MAMNDYLEDALLDHIFGNGAFSVPGALYIALLGQGSHDTDDTSTNEAKELINGSAANWTAAGYAREVIACDTVTPGTGTTSNNAQLTFGPALTDWPLAVGAWLLDSATWNAGNILFHGALATSKDAGVDDTIIFATGEIDITLD